MSFLFRIDHISPNFESQPLQHFDNGDWKPPTWAVGLATTGIGHLYRWRGGVATIVPQNDAAFASILHYSTQYQQSAATVFTQMPWSQRFLAVEFDARYTNVDSNHRWERLMFTHTQHSSDQRFYYSELGIIRDSLELATRSNAAWQHDLFPPQMHCDINTVTASTRLTAGLTGKLPLLLAVIAFSGGQQYLANILQNCLRPSQHPGSSLGSWQHLQGQAHGRTQFRGVVVTVYRDPSASAECQTSQWFMKLETGRLGAFLI